MFGEPTATLDLVEGMKKGYLVNVDYRMHTDNIDWRGLSRLHGGEFTPSQINRTLFITEWNDAVVNELRSTWKEVKNPRAIVFCGTIAHAIRMRDSINALGFCFAQAIYSTSPDAPTLRNADRQKIIADFQTHQCDVICAVDILNEGIDVPDVNILVFQRVTHSRRIFVQQLGRGLRISPNKDKVVVLDFVSDIRRLAAGFELQHSLAPGQRKSGYTEMSIGNKVTFIKAGVEDRQAQNFLENWITDINQAADADDNTAILRFPPDINLQSQ